ncbi:Non-catalytic module family DOC2 [Piromyces sp. E2]|nr:Non-catalytic module family DOC2 [Piromyces sp. E2]|eukprot:OUM62290.1 Non-catalytic module family DOC2 [Piromyces sp. E2]
MRKEATVIALLILLAKAKAEEFYCWSKEVFDIECCPKGTTANYFDGDGDWYLNDNGEKCGIIDGNCWSKFFGYPCCMKHHENDTTLDSHGAWYL